jgi:hypothetical protein
VHGLNPCQNDPFGAPMQNGPKILSVLAVSPGQISTILYEKNCYVLLSTNKKFQKFRPLTMEVRSKIVRDFQKA